MNPLSGGGMGGGSSLSTIANQVKSGWANVAASSFAMAQGTAQNEAIAKAQQENMQKQALIKMVTDIIEGACKMVKGAGEAIKGLC
ncbi:hypothetical protein [Piscinibacter sp.]|uniref:hypothetical protein n=1 Tax=Piscinibacter sp. TaxID=1903157 RepID=UPI002ED0FEFD